MTGKPKNCTYPDCFSCPYDDCYMDGKDIDALLKRNRWRKNPKLYQQKQRDYRSRTSKFLPHCDECAECVLVANQKGDGYRRLCIKEMRLIEQKVSNSPLWCEKRKGAETNARISAVNS